MTISYRHYLTGMGLLAMLGLALPVSAQDKDDKKQREQQEALQREAQPVVLAVNDLHKQPGAKTVQSFVVNPKERDLAKALGAATPSLDPASVGWQVDMMKAADGKVYVPYTVTVPADTLPSGPVSVYVRVVPDGTPLPNFEEGEEEAERKDEAAPVAEFVFEDYFSLEPRRDASNALRITRALAALPGQYDVYLGLRAKPADPNKGKDDPVKVVALQKDLSLPNYWNDELTTSTVVVTSKVDTVQGAVTPEMQRERPYLFGQTEFYPSVDNRFRKNEELSIIFQIYNPSLQGGKPDVAVEYSFHQKLPEGEKYFNKTTPQQLNGQTLPPSFDVSATKMLPGGQSLPLASFPPGDYRMEIKITDNHAKKTITRDVQFTVLAS
jgi:hypothetical protein